MRTRSHTRARGHVSQTPARTRVVADAPGPEFGGEWTGDMQAARGNQAVLGYLQNLTGAGARQTPEVSSDDAVPEGPDRITTARHGVQGPSEALPFEAPMEQSFGEAAAGARAHTGPAAQAATRALGVQAFALGDDVAFGSEHPPKQVVAHEVAHVAQQRAGQETGVQGKGGTHGSRTWEQEADRAADRAVAGETGLATDLSAATPGAVQGFNESSGSIDGSGYSSESGSIEDSQVPDTTIPAEPYAEPEASSGGGSDPVQDYWDQVPDYYEEQTRQEAERAEEVVDTLEGWGQAAGDIVEDLVPDAGPEAGSGEAGTAGLDTGKRTSTIIPVPVVVEIDKSCKYFTLESVTLKTEIKIVEPGGSEASEAPVDVNVGPNVENKKSGKTKGGPSASAKKAAESEWASWSNTAAGGISLKGEVEGEVGTGGVALGIGVKFGTEDLEFKCPVKILNWEPDESKKALDPDNLEVLSLEPEATAKLDVTRTVGDVELTWSSVGIALKITPAFAEVAKQLMIRAFGSAAMLTTAFLLGGFYTLWAAYKTLSSIPDPDAAKAEADALTQDGVNGFIDGLFGHTSGGGASANGQYLLDSNQAGWAAREKALELFQDDPDCQWEDMNARTARLDAALMERMAEYRSAAESAARPKARRLVWDAWYGANKGEVPSTKLAVAAGIFGLSIPADVRAQAEETPGFFD
ncbi:MAG: DUF4157 domain-containing protein [Deltaproteobacteria bacterium]|nr:DUF4157 domain-containing protein [Deltaproteobacteria bacterium]